jgi:subtilase family serine protease
VSQTGSTSSLPRGNRGWAGEISLDVDMVSATCPSCHILLVEAKTPTDANLFTAEDTAVALGAKYVSNSWGGSEASNQTTYDTHLNHPGVAITVSSGDDGNGVEFPASSRYVTAVGGTSLTKATSTTRGWTEKVWSGAGSGCSSYETKPSWQTVTTGCAKRAEADVAAVADPNTGVAVYQTYGASGWSVYGGTSAAAPIIAAVYALAGTPGSSDTPASYPYAHPGSLFDITSGNNGSCGAPQCTAGTGWDGPTGLGTPNGTAAFH